MTQLAVKTGYEKAGGRLANEPDERLLPLLMAVLKASGGSVDITKVNFAALEGSDVVCRTRKVDGVETFQVVLIER